MHHRWQVQVRHGSPVSGCFLTQLMDVTMCKVGSLRQTGQWLLDDANTPFVLLSPPLSVQVLHGNNLPWCNRRASKHLRFMCCEIDYMPWLMLHPCAAAVWMETFRLCLKRQFKGFRMVTVFISFVSRITLLWNSWMDGCVWIIFFPPHSSVTFDDGWIDGDDAVFSGSRGRWAIWLPNCLPDRRTAKASPPRQERLKRKM